MRASGPDECEDWRMPQRTDAGSLDPGLRASIERSGYYPALVAEAVETALGGEPVISHLVHQETTFDAEEVRRHVDRDGAARPRLDGRRDQGGGRPGEARARHAPARGRAHGRLGRSGQS